MEFDEEFLLQGDSLRARRNLITPCEDRIALTKSSKGGVKARAQRGNRTRPSEWTTPAGTRQKKAKLNFPWIIKKNNVRRETENGKKSSFGLAKQFLFRDSFASIQSDSD